jgi:DNA (cytosine-5)-methyltransferase 1
MRHASLFSGIGGFDLAAEWMGWENVFHCEWMEFPRKVLDYYWADADSYTDICKTDFKKYANTIDILTGGFPCQPFSMAGKRKGTEDERYLWHEMLRAVQEIKPTYVIAENVFGITNIDGGLVFEQVCLDLEAEGYEVQPFIIPAASKNAPHRRDRVWFVAYSNLRGRCGKTRIRENDLFGSQRKESNNYIKPTNSRLEKWNNNGNATNPDSNGLNQRNGNNEEQSSKRGEYAQCDAEQSNVHGNITDTKNIGRKDALENGKLERGRFRFGNKSHTWSTFPLESPVCGGDDGLPTQLDGITFSKWRAESIKGYGNAIVPQVAYEIFKQLQPTANCDNL